MKKAKRHTLNGGAKKTEKIEAKISLIIPVYNSAEYISNCLDSILTQTLKEIEVICVNDASTDESLQILRKYQGSDNRIVVKSLQENSGAGVARNVGLQCATGEFVAFIDGDDWYPDCDILESLYKGAKEHNQLICGGSFSSFKNSNIITEFRGLNSQYVFKEEGVIQYRDYQFEFGYQRFIFNRRLIIENKIIFPDYRRFQDPPFLVKAMTAAREFYALPKVVYRYREDYKQIQWTPKKAMDLLKGVTDILQMSDANNYDELHFRTYNRLLNYCDIFYRAYTKDPEYCLPIIIRANRSVNLATVRLYNKNIDENSVIPVLDQIIHCPIKEEREEPKVSVIIPIYNVESFIVECVGSAVNQTLKDIEIICVDDETPDDSIRLIEQNFGTDKRIKIVHKKNGGLSSARNAGAKIARGKYIYFLDSDDYIDTNALEVLYNEASANDLDVLVFDADSFSDERFTPQEEKAFMDRKVQNYLNYYHRTGDYFEVVKGQVLFLRMKAKDEHRSAVWLQFINRDYYVKNKIDSYNGILHEDNLFTLKSLLLANRTKYIRENFYHRRVRIGSIMTEKEGIKNLKGYFVTYCEALRFLMRKSESFYPKVREAYLNEMNKYAKSICRIAKIVSDDELQEFYSSLCAYEKILYDLLLASGEIEKCIDTIFLSTEKIENKINELVENHNLNNPDNKLDGLETGIVKRSGSKIDVGKIGKKRKTGQGIFWLPRKVKNFFKCWREHGFRYTMIRLFKGREKANLYEANKK